MRRLRNVFIIFLGLFLMTGCLKSEAEKNRGRVNKILTHMEKKYGEKFYMSSPFGGRGQNDALRIMVKPERYRGTAKEYDDYYEDYAFIKTDGKIGDAFGTIYLKEGAEEYFKPKLKELFGENVLIAIVPEGRYVFVDFKEEMERRSNVYNSNPIGNYSPLSGGIYIFGRVENESDREYYRKRIYEFIQYLKAENMFDYAYIGIAIVDERFLAKDFSKEEFLELYSQDTSKTKEEYRKKRKELIKKYNDSYEKTSEEYKQQKLANIRKSDLFGERPIGIDKYTGRNRLLSSGVYGDKYIKSSSGRREWMIESNRIPSNYNLVESISEVQLREERW